VSSQRLEERVVGVVGVTAGERHRVGVRERRALARIEGAVARDLADDRVQLVVRDTRFAADGSVDVLSEDAAVVRGDATVDERLELEIDQPELTQRAPHPAHAAEERGEASIDEMVEEGGAPLPGLGVEDAGDLGGNG
jgi:hypothetical protein